MAEPVQQARLAHRPHNADPAAPNGPRHTRPWGPNRASWSVPGQCQVNFAEGCHFYIAVTGGCRISHLLENRRRRINRYSAASRRGGLKHLMLPWWMNDLSIVATLVTATPTIIGWVLGWLAGGSGPVAPPPVAPVPTKITLRGAFKTGVLNGIIRPDIPLSTEVVRAVGATAILTISTTLYFWAERSTAIVMPWDQPLRHFVLYLFCLYGVFLIFVWARLSWKRDYLNRMSDNNDDSDL